MTNNLKVKTSDVPVITDKQATEFANNIFADIKGYIAEHQAEYLQFLAGTESKGGDVLC